MEMDFIKNRVCTIRTAKKLSARNLSLELGMSTEYINQLESGRLKPSLEFLLNFCDYFNMTVGEFFDETVKYPIETKEIVSELNKLPPDALPQIYNLLKLINKE